MNTKREERVEELCEGFETYFKERFKKSTGRIVKTAFHFLNYVAAGNDARREELVLKYYAYAKRRGVMRTWRNAAEWYARHGEAVAK